MRALGRLLLLISILVIAAGIGWFSSRWVSEENSSTLSADATSPSVQTIVEVVEQSIGRDLAANVTITPVVRAVGTNRLSGVITELSEPDLVRTGDRIYSVNEVPVRVVDGLVPFYRDLEEGMSGRDVDQLRTALVQLGYLPFGQSGPFDWRMIEAVVNWQKALGLPRTGLLKLGELIAVSELPATVQLAPEYVVGSDVAGGEKIVSTREADLEFTLVLSQSQLALARPDLPITVQYEDQQWSAVVNKESVDSNGNTTLKLIAPNGASVCADSCPVVDAGGSVTTTATLQVVPPAVGPAVPVAAINQSNNGRATVTLEGGRTVEVTVRSSQNGVAIVDGLAIGDRVVF